VGPGGDGEYADASLDRSPTLLTFLLKLCQLAFDFRAVVGVAVEPVDSVGTRDTAPAAETTATKCQGTRAFA